MTCLTGHCVTCADEGTPMRVLPEAGGAGEPAADGGVRCRAEDGTEREVDATLVEPVAPGDLLLVHAGVALTHLDEPAESAAREVPELEREGASLSPRTPRATGSARGARGEGPREQRGVPMDRARLADPSPRPGVAQGGPSP